MPQGILPFQYQVDQNSGITSRAGLMVYFELAIASRVIDALYKRLNVRESCSGWSDTEVAMTLVLLNLTGGEHVADVEHLQADSGLRRILLRVLLWNRPRQERRQMEHKWRREARKGKTKRVVPSQSAVFRFLNGFHIADLEEKRQEALEAGVKAFIPQAPSPLLALQEVVAEVGAFVQRCSPSPRATLDMDATLIEVWKESALPCYKGYRAYQPLNVYWFEQDQIVYSEFRDGNVPAGYRQLDVFKRALKLLPEGIEEACLRSDTAGYEWDLLKYCAEGKNERFGVIPFAVGVDVTPEFKIAVAQLQESDWKPLPSLREGVEVDLGQQVAEVCFVPNAISNKKHGPSYRFLAIREPLEQPTLPNIEIQADLPFPTMNFGTGPYKLFGVVTNRKEDGAELIRWHRQRCGKSEEAHAIMKSDLAGGTLPSGDFGANAAWWTLMILAFNLHSAMKHLVLGGRWKTRRMKAIRFALINIPGRVVEHARQIIVRVDPHDLAYDWLVKIRRRIKQLVKPDT